MAPQQPVTVDVQKQEVRFGDRVIKATVPDGPPRHFTWRRALHAVVRVEGPERIAMEWWKQDGAVLTRDYFRIEDEAGLRFWIFRDGLYDRELIDAEGKPMPANWFVHGLFA